MAIIESLQEIIQRFSELLQILDQLNPLVVTFLTLIVFFSDLRIKKREMTALKTKRMLFFNIIYESSRSVKEFYSSVFDEIMPKKVYIPILFGAILPVIFGCFEIYYKKLPILISQDILPKLMELFVITGLALAASLIIVFVLITSLYYIVDFADVQPNYSVLRSFTLTKIKKLKIELYKNLVFYTFVFWGALLFVLAVTSIITTIFELEPKDIVKYSLISLIALFLAILFIVMDHFVISSRIKIRTLKLIEFNKINSFRDRFPMLNVCTACGVTSGILWAITEQSLLLNSTGVITIPWNEISWIEVIENEKQSNETPKKTKSKKESGWIDYLGFVTLSILIMLLAYFGNLLNFNDIDNERYVLSAIIQSEAAILAIVASLSLIAVQLTASSYSPRVVELFRGRDYLDLWFLSILYIFSMTITIFILKNLNEDSNFTWMDSKIPIFLAILCFTLLIPYTRRLLEYLKPSTSIEKFAKKINKTNLIKAFIEEDETKIEEKDPLQPIVDIIYNAIQRKDLETVRNGLKAIVSRTISTMDSFSNSEMRKGDGVLVEVVSHLTNICKFSIDVGDWNSVRLVTEAIKKIGIKAAELGFEKTINMIDHFANNVIMRDPRTYRDSILLIGEIGKSASENKKIYTIIGILNRLESLGNKFINKGRKLELDFVATKIKEICEKVPRDIDKDGKASRTDILNIAISNLKNLKREAQNRNIDASHIDWCIYEIEKIKH